MRGRLPHGLSLKIRFPYPNDHALSPTPRSNQLHQPWLSIWSDDYFSNQVGGIRRETQPELADISLLLATTNWWTGVSVVVLWSIVHDSYASLTSMTEGPPPEFDSRISNRSVRDFMSSDRC